MIVFDLRCDNGHVFEAWFGSSDSFEKQRKAKLLCCAICSSVRIEKAPMAARLPAKSNRKEIATTAPPIQAAASTTTTPDFEDAKAFLTAVAKAQKAMLKGSQWVGKDFDKRARAMDAGDAPHETIHGEVTNEEARSLIEDGIDVTPLPLPVIPPEKQN